MTKDANVSRRKFLVGGAGTIMAGAIAGSVGGALAKPKTASADIEPAPVGYLPGPEAFTVPIDTRLVRALCFRHYMFSGG